MPRKLLLYFLLNTIFHISVLPVYSQPIQYKANFYSIPEGLSSAELYDVIQDSKGFIWLSMNNKLNRFDGYTFSEYAVTDKKLTSKNYLINDLSVLEKLGSNYFIVAYLDGEGIFDLVNTKDLSIKSYDLKHEFPGSKVIGFTALANAEQLNVFCVLNNEIVLFYFNPIDHRKEKIASFSLLPFAHMDTLLNVQFSTSNSGISYLSIGGLPLICFNPTAHLASPIPIKTSIHGYHLIKAFGDHLYLVDYDQRKLLKYDHLNQALNDIPTGKLNGKIDNLWMDEDENIILGSAEKRYFKELILLTKNSTKSESLDFIIKKEDKISQIQGAHFLEQLLISTFGGFYILSHDKKIFKTELTKKIEHGKYGNILRAMEEDGQGNLYIAEEGNHIYKLKLFNDSILTIYKKGGEKLPAIGCIRMVDHHLWGISYTSAVKKELYNFDTHKEKFKFWDLPFSSFRIKDFVVTDFNRFLFFGFDEITDTLAVWSFDHQKEKWIPFPLHPFLGKLVIQIALSDSQGTIWLGTTNGLYIVNINEHHIEKVAFGNSESPEQDSEINALAFQPTTHHLLIGNEDGIWLYNQTNKKYINHYNKQSNGISNNLIEGILPLNEHELFATSQYGLNYLNLSSGTVINYYTSDGLANNEFNRFSIHHGSNGKYYFGGVNGLSILSMDDISKPSNSNQVVLSRFYRNDFKSGNEISIRENLDTLKSVTIEPEDQYFGFDFMSPAFADPASNQFQTWLEGYDKSWQHASNLNHVRYGRLPKGNYILHIKAEGSSANETILNIKVKEHYYQSPWFIPSISLALLALGLGSIYNFKNKQRKEEFEKHQAEQKFKDLETSALRAQMNPHFIFNCLGSIQQFILEHDSDSATKYLSSFARLIRLSLHSSVDGRHSLQDEIDMLENYLGLERLRFGNTFTYSITASDQLDKNDIYFPPLLIQPFVENALVHGMKHKENSGKINIIFKLIEELLHVSVADNGPGISRMQDTMNTSGHKSVGMTLTQHRLEILSNKNSFSMIPILDDEGKVEGTLVSIVIPIF